MQWSDVERYGRRVSEVCFSPLNAVLDGLYDRLDLWADRETREADHAKVRGCLLFLVVCYIMAEVARRSTSLTFGYFEVLMFILCIAAGERIMMAFLSAWGARGVADAGVGAAKTDLIYESPGRDHDKGIDPPDESKLPPVP